MKYKPRDYAKAFIEVADRATTKEQQEAIVKNFLALVIKNGDARQLGKIIELIENIAYRQAGRTIWFIESARPLKDVRHFFKKIIKPNDIVNEKVNPELIAGVKITKNNEEQFDGSLRRKIEKIFTN